MLLKDLRVKHFRPEHTGRLDLLCGPCDPLPAFARKQHSDTLN